MIAQDTGSAIVGPARADVYWGAGDDAGRIAGRIRHPARFVMLLPRELDMIEAGKRMPLPLPKPKFAEVEVRKQNGRRNADHWKPLASHSAPPVVQVSKQGSIAHNKQVRLNSPLRRQTLPRYWIR